LKRLAGPQPVVGGVSVRGEHNNHRVRLETFAGRRSSGWVRPKSRSGRASIASDGPKVCGGTRSRRPCGGCVHLKLLPVHTARRGLTAERVAAPGCTPATRSGPRRRQMTWTCRRRSDSRFLICEGDPRSTRIRWSFPRFSSVRRRRSGAVDRSRGQGGSARSEARTNDLDAGEDRRVLAWLDERRGHGFRSWFVSCGQLSGMRMARAGG
jgi:hypothetical protein